MAHIEELAHVVNRIAQAEEARPVEPGLSLLMPQRVGIGQHLISVHQQLAVTKAVGHDLATPTHAYGFLILAHAHVYIAYLTHLKENAHRVHTVTAGIFLGLAMHGYSLPKTVFCHTKDNIANCLCPAYWASLKTTNNNNEPS